MWDFVSVAGCWQEAKHCLCTTCLVFLLVSNNSVFLSGIPVAAPPRPFSWGIWRDSYEYIPFFPYDFLTLKLHSPFNKFSLTVKDKGCILFTLYDLMNGEEYYPAHRKHEFKVGWLFLL